MFDKDGHTIFEAYRTILEAPIDPGEAWDMPSTDVAGKLGGIVSSRNKKTLDELLTQYSVVELENRINIIDYTRQYLESLERHFRGSAKEFADSLAEKLKSKAGDWSFKTFRAPHIARVIVNALLELNVITADGTINDPGKLEDEMEVLDTPVEKEPDAPSTPSQSFDLDGIYVVDPLGANDLSSGERSLSDYIPEEGATGKEIIYLLNNTVLWRDANKNEPDRTRQLKLHTLLSNWAKSGILIKKKEEAEEVSDTRDIDVEDPRSSAQHAPGDYLASQGIDVPAADPYSGEVGGY